MFRAAVVYMGDNPCLRWATNNTNASGHRKKSVLIPETFFTPKSKPKVRKTDPFMALVASMTCESALSGGSTAIPPIGAIKI